MRIRRSILLAALAAAAGALAAAGCQPAYRPMPYMPKPLTAPQPLACHDAIGHITSNKPWVLGGTCCCTPTAANFAIHRNNGTVDKSMTYEAYLALFKEKGVVTDLDHKGCGNVCTSGPHVLLGGKCMATPAPGTWMYERITYGPHTPLTADDAKAGHAPAAPMTPYGPYGPRAGMM